MYSIAGALLNKDTKALCSFIRTGYDLQNDSPEIETLQLQVEKGSKPNLVIEDELIYYVDPKSVEGDLKRIYIPREARYYLLKLAHDDPVHGGHLGIKKTFRKLCKFWWQGMSKDVEDYVKSCDICQQFKNPAGLPPGYLQSIPVSKIFKHVHIDMVGPIKKTTRGNAYIITATDAFSKWAFARPCQSITTSNVIKFAEECILAIHGKPQFIISDRGTQFTSHEWDNWLKKHDITHKMTTPYHPQSNRIDERLDGTLARILRAYVDNNQSNWDTQLMWALYVYNTTVHESTGYSPYQVLHGLDPRSALKNDEVGDSIEVDRLNNLRQLIRKKTNSNNEEVQGAQKREYDRRHVKSTIQVGDLVMARESTVPTGWSNKFYPKWYGPCVVVSIIGDRNNPKAVAILDCVSLKRKNISMNDVKPYLDREDRKEATLSEEGEALAHNPDHHKLSETAYHVDSTRNIPNLIDLNDRTVVDHPRSNMLDELYTDIDLSEHEGQIERQASYLSDARMSLGIVDNHSD